MLRDGIFIDLLNQGLVDDDWKLDWTTQSACSSGATSTAKVIAKSSGVWAAESLAADLMKLAPELKIQGLLKDGESFKPGDVLMKWSGPSRLVLGLERVSLNLASYACGVATRTHQLVQAVKSAGQARPRICSTRKILPHYRLLSIHSVQAGGGHSHRPNLSSGVLIKENHIQVAGGIAPAIRQVRALAPHGLKIEVEVRDLHELAQAIEARADAVLLDNFKPEQVKQAIAQLKKNSPPPIVEVSGGITLENIAGYCIDGVDVISSGALTHSVASVDLSLLMDPVSAR